MNVTQKCNICIKECYNLRNISETDSNNLKWSYKLSSCVPEVDWIEEYQICNNCIIQLEAAYAFRDLCLGSFAKQKLQENFTQILCYCGGKCYDTLHQSSSTLPTFYNLPKFDGNEPKLCSSLHTELVKSQGEGYNFNCVKDQFVCFHCGFQFTRKLLLIAHIRTKHKRNASECSFCQKVHVMENCPERKLRNLFNCNKCLQSFTTENSLIIHSKNCCYNSKPEGLSQTKYLEDEPSAINKEVPKRGRKRLDTLSNKCNICGMNFNTRYLAKRHVRNVHATEKNYQCEICQQRFASPVYLNAHKRYHSGERPHICSFCGKGFITGSDLYHHEKIHQNKRAYKCDKCPKAFNTSSDLHKHKLCVHQDRSAWKYVCSYCNRRFPLKTNLDAHTKTHTGERNFACHLCNHKCVNRSVLLRHIKSHSNVRLFKCNLCSMEYKYQKSLDIHMTKTHGIGDAKIPERIKKYFCHICPKSYFANNKLQKHIRTHTGERPFSCHICEKRFIDKSYIKQHLKTAHNIIFNDVDV